MAAAGPVGVDGFRTRGPAEVVGAGRDRDDHRAHPGPRGQPHRGRVVRRRHRDDPSGTGTQPGAADQPGTSAAPDCRPVEGHHRPVPPAPRRPRAGPPPLAADHRLRLHHPAGLGAAAGLAGPAPRRGGHPGGRPARVRAPSGGDGLRRGRRDGRADLRRHQRPGVPCAAARRLPGSARRPWSRQRAGRAPRSTRSRPTTTSSGPWPASPSCADGGADELRVADPAAVPARGPRPGGRVPGAAAPSRPAPGTAGRRGSRRRRRRATRPLAARCASPAARRAHAPAGLAGPSRRHRCRAAA